MNESQFMLLHSITGVGLLMIIAAICVSDARQRRIPNLLVLSGLLVASGFHAIAPAGRGVFVHHLAGGLGLREALLGAVICFGFFLVLHLMRVMGAGDVKLMAFMGALFGASESANLILAVLLCGGLLSLSRMFQADRRHRVMANLRLIVMERIASPTGGAALFDPEKDTVERLPFALAICSAAVLLAIAQQKGLSMPWAIYG